MPTSATLSYTSLSEVPDTLRDHVTEKEDGSYSVSVVLASDLKEFRDKNVDLLKSKDQMTAALQRYEQVTGVPLETLEEGRLEDFAKVLTELRETKQRVDDGKLVEETSLEEASASRVAQVRQEMRGQIDALTKDRDAHKEAKLAAERRANEMIVENMIRQAASDPDVAMIDRAVTMVLPQALRVFKVDEDGRVTPKEADGTTLYGNDGMNPMSPKEWLLKQREDNDFLFQGARGGGASGGTDTAPGKLSWEQLQKLPPAVRMQQARAGKA